MIKILSRTLNIVFVITSFSVIIISHHVYASEEQASSQNISTIIDGSGDSGFIYTTRASLEDGFFSPPNEAIRKKSLSGGHVRRVPAGWVKTSGNSDWIGNYAALGNEAENVFTYYDLNHTGAALFPVQNTNPPIAAWEIFSDPLNLSYPRGVAAAKSEDVYVAIIETKDVLNPTLRDIDIQRYSSQGKLEWSYRYPFKTNQPLATSSSHIGISNDGQTIAAIVYNAASNINEVLIFSPYVSTPISSYTFEGGIVWKMDLSADGNFVALGINTKIYVVETQTGNRRFDKDTFAQISDSGLAISGDGSVLVYGGGAPIGFLEGYIWTQATAIYNLRYIVPSPLVGWYRTLEISDDGSTLAAGMGELYPLKECRVEARDAQTGALLMGETVTSVDGPNDYQNVVMDVAISADGSRMAAALAGDEDIAPLVEEIRVYDTSVNVPIFKRNLSGSATSVDMSSSGHWVVAGSKAVHINELGRDGQIDLIYVP